MKVIHDANRTENRMLCPWFRCISLWSLVSAIRSITKRLFPDCHCYSCHSLTALRALLPDIPGARFIFCLRPREQIFLFYTLNRILSRSPLLVITDRLLPTDHVVLETCDCALNVSHAELSAFYSHLCIGNYLGRGGADDFLDSQESVYVLTGTGITPLPLHFRNGSDLISFMNEQLHLYMQRAGVTVLQLRPLEKMRSEPTLKKLTIALDINIKTLSYNEASVFSKLDMEEILPSPVRNTLLF